MGDHLTVRHLTVRPIDADDWEGIVALESQAYTPLGLSEDRDSLESRVLASPTTCFVLEHEEAAGTGPARDRHIAGYTLALPYPRFQYPGLGLPERTTFRSDNLHLHDLVVDQRLRGRGLAGRLLGRLQTVARTQQHRHISLVAVAGTETFWSRHGFTHHPEVTAPEHYGPNACYMSKPVGVAPSHSPSDDAAHDAHDVGV